uniref:Si:dkey-7k24.5 n=1 Tax=Oncorhynchus kisutch TaxID=8019 RepID=A0A8C7CWH4_ONCKI
LSEARLLLCAIAMPPFRYTVTGRWIYYCVGLMVFLVGWRADRSYGTCYCDQACTSTLDCCHDYELACPAVSCVVSEWSAWSGCAESCRATVRMRSRQVLQEGEPCPHVEEHAGCAEYWDHHRQCSKSLGKYHSQTYSLRLKKKDIPVNNDDDVTGHCVQFQLTSLTPWCQRSVGPHTRWMQYLKEGHQVCVECQPPALAAGQRHCTGDGEEESGRQSQQWQAVGNPRCRVVWRRVGRLDSCSCPTIHSFLFI